MPQLQRLTHTTRRDERLPYLFAASTGQAAKAPLLLFLHGGRDRGDDLDLLLRWSPPKRVAEAAELPYHFAAPQIPADATWPAFTDALLELVDHLATNPGVDTDRVLLAGFSLGASGAWQIASQHPGRFAGLVAVSGRPGEGVNLPNLRSLPVWVFHGKRDDRVASTDVEPVLAQLRVQGTPVRYTLYAEGDHFISEAAYGDAGLEDWLLSQRRPPR